MSLSDSVTCRRLVDAGDITIPSSDEAVQKHVTAEWGEQTLYSCRKGSGRCHEQLFEKCDLRSCESDRLEKDMDWSFVSEKRRILRVAVVEKRAKFNADVCRPN